MNECVNEWTVSCFHCGPTFNTHPVENRLPKTIRNLRPVTSHSPALQGHANHVCVLDVLLWILVIHRGIQHVAFYVWLLLLKMCWPGASILSLVWKVHSLPWLSDIPLYQLATFDLSVHHGCIYLQCVFFGYWSSPVESFRHVWLFATPWTAACQASLFIINSQSLCPLWLMSIKLVMSSNHLILWHPHLLPTSVFPSFSQSFTQSVSSLHQMVEVLQFQFQY